MTVVSHPAPYSDPIVDKLRRLIDTERKKLTPAYVEVLDPFAGIGRIHQLHRPGSVETTGLEIEPEWAATHERTVQGNVFAMPRRWRRRFRIVATSPTYGNRMADHHTPSPADTSTRYGYAYQLGRQPDPESSATLPWGPRYWAFHAGAYAKIFEVLEPEGLFLLNVSNFIKDGEEVHAAMWHLGAAYGAGFEMRSAERPLRVVTKRMKNGANHAARVDGEVIIRLRRPAA